MSGLHGLIKGNSECSRIVKFMKGLTAKMFSIHLVKQYGCRAEVHALKPALPVIVSETLSEKYGYFSQRRRPAWKISI